MCGSTRNRAGPFAIEEGSVGPEKIDHESDESVGQVLCLSEGHLLLSRRRLAQAAAQLVPQRIVGFHLLRWEQMIKVSPGEGAGPSSVSHTLHLAVTTVTSGSRRDGGRSSMSSRTSWGAISLLLSISTRMTSSMESDIFLSSATLSLKMPESSEQ